MNNGSGLRPATLVTRRSRRTMLATIQCFRSKIPQGCEKRKSWTCQEFLNDHPYPPHNFIFVDLFCMLCFGSVCRRGCLHPAADEPPTCRLFPHFRLTWAIGNSHAGSWATCWREPTAEEGPAASTVLTSLLKRFIGIGTYWNQIWSLENQTITQPPIYLGFNWGGQLLHEDCIYRSMRHFGLLQFPHCRSSKISSSSVRRKRMNLTRSKNGLVGKDFWKPIAFACFY